MPKMVYGSNPVCLFCEKKTMFVRGHQSSPNDWRQWLLTSNLFAHQMICVEQKKHLEKDNFPFDTFCIYVNYLQAWKRGRFYGTSWSNGPLKIVGT